MSIERTIYTNVRYVRMCVQRMFVLLSGCLSNCLWKAIHETSNEPSLIMLMFDWPHTLESFGNIYYMPQLQNAFNIIEINMAQSSNISNVGMWATYLQFTFDVESKPCVFFLPMFTPEIESRKMNCTSNSKYYFQLRISRSQSSVDACVHENISTLLILACVRNILPETLPDNVICRIYDPTVLHQSLHGLYICAMYVTHARYADVIGRRTS